MLLSKTKSHNNRRDTNVQHVVYRYQVSKIPWDVVDTVFWSFRNMLRSTFYQSPITTIGRKCMVLTPPKGFEQGFVHILKRQDLYLDCGETIEITKKKLS